MKGRNPGIFLFVLLLSFDGDDYVLEDLVLPGPVAEFPPKRLQGFFRGVAVFHHEVILFRAR